MTGSQERDSVTRPEGPGEHREGTVDLDVDRRVTDDRRPPRPFSVVRVSLCGVPIWSWLTGLVLSLAVMGPALRPGSLLNLDLVMVPDPPVPSGVWGLGPELPRRVPMWVPVAWLSTLVGGDLVARLLMVGGLLLAFVGMYRLTARLAGGRGGAAWAALGAAVLYAFGPFMITRLAVGHLMIVWTMALLPWALPDLLRPDRRVRRVLLWSAAIGFTGIYGGTVVALVLAAGVIATRGRRVGAIVGAYLVAQLPWLVPLAIVGSGQSAIADATGFPTVVSGFDGVGRLLAGHGFWNPPFQIGAPGGWGVALIGFALLGLATVGTSALPRAWRVPLVALAALGLLISAASGVHGLDDLVARASRSPIGAPFRETQRLLSLYLLWMAPAAALGALSLADRLGGQAEGRGSDRGRGWSGGAARVVAAVPLALGLVLLGPGLWGAGGQLEPVHYPAEWAEARAAVRADPGTVVALPWYEYFSFNVAQNRLVLNTVPLYFGGDVITSSDPGVGSASNGSTETRERYDRRETAVDEVVHKAKVTGPADDPCGIFGAKVTPGQPISSDLARLGVRWVVMMKDVDWLCYLPALSLDGGLESVVSGPNLELYRVKDWAGPVVADDGRPVSADAVISPWWDVGASGPARMAVSGSRGWLRGTTPAGVTDDGLLALPAGRGPVWYWPAVVTLLADAVWLAALLWAGIGERRSRRVVLREGEEKGQDPDRTPSGGLAEPASGKVPLGPRGPRHPPSE